MTAQQQQPPGITAHAALLSSLHRAPQPPKPLHRLQGHPAAVRSVLLGDCFVVGAQLLAALQFIVEEKYLTRYSVPALLAVGLEGCWGLLICCAALPALSWLPGPGGQPLDSFSLAIRVRA